MVFQFSGLHSARCGRERPDGRGCRRPLCLVFLLLTAPITANFIAKTYMARNVRPAELPESASEYGWSIYDEPPETRPDA